MKLPANTLRFLLSVFVVLLMATTSFAGDRAEIRLTDGSRWRGEMDSFINITYSQLGVEQQFIGRLVQVEDLYIVVEGDVAGKTGKKLIYKGDLLAITNADEQQTQAALTVQEPRGGGSGHSTSQPAYNSSNSDLGVFILPLDGPVGESIRHTEIQMIGEHADKYGPGQIIVLVVNTNGGLVLESEKIVDTVRDIKKRHRVIAWIKKAISAGAMTAMCCEEIYFTSEGTCGSVTTLMGNRSAPQEVQDENTKYFAELAIENGHSPHIARSMKQNKYMCSYDKDPETGEVTWFDDLSGEFILSDGSSNLTFNSTNALHCGFSNGTADTPEELAKLLQLPEWNEKSDYGRRIAADWQRTVDQAKTEIPRLLTRLSYWKQGSRDPMEILGGQIQIMTELVKWTERAEVLAAINFGLDKASVERELEELRKEMADMRRAQRNNR